MLKGNVVGQGNSRHVEKGIQQNDDVEDEETVDPGGEEEEGGADQVKPAHDTLGREIAVRDHSHKER